MKIGRGQAPPLHKQIRRVGTMFRLLPGICDIVSLRNPQVRRLLGGAEREEVLGAFDGFLESLEEELEVVAALDEIDVGGVDDQKVGGGVAKKEMFVGAGDFGDVF